MKKENVLQIVIAILFVINAVVATINNNTHSLIGWITAILMLYEIER